MVEQSRQDGARQERPRREGSRQEREPVGSVAEETARLVEALGGWADGLRAHHDDAARADGEPPHEEPSHQDRPHQDPPHQDPPHEEPARAKPDHGTAARCEHCGVSSRAGEALACRLCPVCQGIAILRTVRPETVERLADVAAALSGALRDIAADRFGQPPPSPPPPPPRGQRVQDIVVDDEDDQEDLDDPSGAPLRRTDPSRTRQESTGP